ncbi:hypothetical protein GCM10027037_13060 [Mucilaginibacter koreensis]
MKNSLKAGLLALTISVSFAACDGNKSTSGSDSTKVDSTAMGTDTTAKVDSTTKDTTVVNADTTHAANGVDTIQKTVTKTSVTKKSTKSE